jgi:hypothetical protein
VAIGRAGQPLELLSLLRFHADTSMQREARVLRGAFLGLVLSRRHRL